MMMIQVLQTLGYYASRLFLLYAFGCLVFPFISLAQEYKVWKPSSLPSLSPWGMLKVYVFNVLWMGACLISALLCLPKYLLTGTVEYASFMWFETTVACGLVRLLVGRVEIRGQQHLPPFTTKAPAPVYIANHSSQLDAAVVYFLKRRFKWIAKASVFYVPGAGQIMYLSGHVFINRKSGNNKNSVASLYEKSNAAIQSGLSMFFFPQGTRNLAQRLPFKDGAFNVAMENGSDLIPISIDIPTSAWNRAYPFFAKAEADPIVLTIHAPISSKNIDKEALKQTCFETIYSTLPIYDNDKKKK
jgi:1-acyl-sn-glycerol-3-phosphate acyltransferase